MKQIIYRVSSKRSPSIWDKGTEFMETTKCIECNRKPCIVLSQGVFFPSYAKDFGIASVLNGFIVSENGYQYLKDNGIEEFEIGKVNILFAKRKSVEVNYLWIRPIFMVDLDNGSGAEICSKCNLGTWKDADWELHKIKGPITSNIFRVRHSWADFCTERFKQVVKSIPGGCFLDFKKWCEYDV